MPPTHNDVEEI